ncbi:zinc finger FYVE domain-containing protein 21-like isoform X2 [Panulirus ornatus]|uniref:zinc finger FYVE domain-containing protein 21-like isoform X2 n=1 Tax=Panulirus ornatus TaxID=150431 RepID=UPI003A8BFD13
MSSWWPASYMGCSLSPTCMDCKKKFDFIKRRHHCRRCGRVCCASCCDTRMALPRMCFLDPVRVCSPCADITLKENHFYNKELKILITGAILCIAADTTSDLVHCCLSSDHRYLIVSGPMTDSGPLLSIPMHRMTGLLIGSRDKDRSGSCLVSALILQYCLAGEEEKEVSLAVPPDSATSAFIFLTALEKAMFMMQESRAVIGTGE